EAHGAKLAYHRDPAKTAEKNRRESAKRKQQRKNGEKTDQFMMKQCRARDKKAGRQTDMDLEFLQEMLQYPCKYCCQVSSRMTLDRIDNSLGYLRTNVNPCCIRCNYVRRDLPYEVWSMIVPGIKLATEQGML